MKKVGIVPTADLFYTDNVYDDKYQFPNTYVTRAVEAGMLPIGILSVDGRVVKESLPAPGVIVSATAADGVTEAIEYGRTVIGTQFHPDVDSKLSCIFSWLAE